MRLSASGAAIATATVSLLDLFVRQSCHYCFPPLFIVSHVFFVPLVDCSTCPVCLMCPLSVSSHLNSLSSPRSQFLGGAVLGLGEWTPRPFPTLSPKKSVGGYLFALVFAGATCWAIFRPRSLTAVLSVLMVGFIGDVAA